MAHEYNHDSEFLGTLKLSGAGTPALNKILTSDASGVATWEVNDGSNIPTALSTGTVTATTYGITSDGGTDDVVLAEATTSTAGLLGAAKWDEIVANTLKVTNVTTNLSVASITTTTLDVVSSDGTDATLPAATASLAGLMTASDKTVLDSVKSIKKTITTAAGGAGTVIAHTLGTADLHVSTYDSSGNKIETEVNVDATNVTIITAVIETAMVVVVSTAPNITVLT